MIVLENVSKIYKNGTKALNDFSLEIEDGEFVYVIGETGSGKSTLIKLLNGEEIPTKGRVLVNGINVGRLRFGKVPLYRRKIGVVFQDYQLLKKKTTFDNIAFALEVINKPKNEVRARVKEVLEIIGMSNEFNSYPTQLSGGQQQRVVIGRAIANKPAILICDEPTGNLDPRHSKEIIELLEKINKSGTTIIVVTHDDVLVDTYRKRTILLDNGSIISDNPEGGYSHV
ncbi:MAG TPA: cell division ATP-binding protein FtsE [Erysipelotrichaceae bacterium]|nr:cell division ATP-binding protein FtsE [Erysipelotrichaceae bacterium]HQB31815.1 cell division ATP-binding protein FtsE [Erysipelotrichaceae bacterium]